jgi:hypothetical protein
LRPSLRLDGHSYTPDLLRRLVTLAGKLSSAEQAAVALQVAADVSISGRHVQRLTREVGDDLTQRRDAQALLHRRRQLVSRVKEAPPLAVVEVDGGRLGTRQAGAGPGVHQKQGKEDKIACLISMSGDTYTEDPQPDPPPAFRDARRVARLVRQLKAQAAPPASAEVAVHEADTADQALTAEKDAQTDGARPAKPKHLVRTCVASMVNSRAFGPLVAAEAQARAFYQAPRQAFLGDGQKYNWSIQRAYFPHFVPIADFLHMMCYLYTASWAVADDEAARWAQFEQWLTVCWQGKVATVVSELATWQERLGRPPPEAEPQDPRQVVAESLTYLRNNARRMNYPHYRRQGLPVTSSLVESLVGEFNARVKSGQKWWDRPEGAEAILQVRAAVLSEDERLERYFAERPGQPYRRRVPLNEQNISIREKQRRS